MYLLFILLFILTGSIITYDIEVLNSGVSRFRKDDMIVVFFITIQHHGQKPQRIMLMMVECCEKITDEESDCNSIELYGGDEGIIEGGAIRNLTMHYPNIYAYNRRGTCLVDIWHRPLGGEEGSEIRHRIDFDTTVTFDEVPPSLQGLYKPDKITKCETTDLDPFDRCNPVYCLLKYSGNRNFYNRKSKRCQKVPTCIADPSKDLPDVAYVPNSNTCRDLESAVSEEDIRLLVHGMAEDKNFQYEPQMVNIRCHHGEIDPRTGLCICDKGWKSEIFDPDTYNPSTSIYSMCNVKCHIEDDQFKFIPIILGVFIAFWLSSCILCCEKYGYFCYVVERIQRMDKCDSQEAVYYPLDDGYECPGDDISMGTQFVMRAGLSERYGKRSDLEDSDRSYFRRKSNHRRFSSISLSK